MEQKSKLKRFFTEDGRPVVFVLLMIIFGFYGSMIHMGIIGNLLGLLLGFSWAVVISLIGMLLRKPKSWRPKLANGTLIGMIVALGLLSGAGIMYIGMMTEALNQASLNNSMLSALMQPAVPYYITMNSLIEMVIVPLLILCNWNGSAKRKAFMIAGLAVWLAMRIWTFLAYAEMRLDVSQGTLSAADIEWFKQTLAVDYRYVLELIAEVLLILAAINPFASSTKSK